MVRSHKTQPGAMANTWTFRKSLCWSVLK